MLAVEKQRPSCERKTASRRSSSVSSAGSLRSPRDISRKHPAQSPRLRPIYHDVSPHLMPSPSTPTNNNNNISKHPVPADQGHFIYPPADMSPRYNYNSPAPSHMSPMGTPMGLTSGGFSQLHSPNNTNIDDYDMNRSYATDRYSSQEVSGYPATRPKSSMGDPGYGMVNNNNNNNINSSNNNNNVPYDYRNVPPSLMDHMKHYSQYPMQERTYPPGYMYSPSPMPSNSMYPLQGLSGNTSERYYPDVLEEFVDMQAVMQHGMPNRPMRGDYNYTPAILTN